MDKAAMETELDEMYVVRRKLLTGSKLESGGHDDRNFTYNRASLPAVEARIRFLEHKLGINQEDARRPIGIDLS